MFVYLQAAWASPLRTKGDVIEADTHQATDVEVTELHLCK